jgi:GT2 family glycosyltransferase
VVCLDADTVPSRRWLAELLSAFTDPAVMIAAGQTLPFPPKTGAERYVATIGLFDAERLVRRDPFPFAPSLNMAVRRDAAQALGGWAEELVNGEDGDFSHRLLQRSDPTKALAYRPDAVLFHHNRATDEALRRQAYTYGEGVASLYLRYPEVVSWDVTKTARVVGLLAWRGVLPAALALGHVVGRVADDRLEFTRYHRLWTWSFYRGFASEYRRKGRSRR